jgi:hypothetical protein
VFYYSRARQVSYLKSISKEDDEVVCLSQLTIDWGLVIIQPMVAPCEPGFHVSVIGLVPRRRILAGKEVYSCVCSVAFVLNISQVFARVRG